MTTIPFGRYKRWAHVSAADRSAFGKWLRRKKGNKHAMFTLRYIGNQKFMCLCMRYQRKYGRKLTPAERAWIKAIHAQEIAASSAGWPWPKKPRVSWPDTSDY